MIEPAAGVDAGIVVEAGGMEGNRGVAVRRALVGDNTGGATNLAGIDVIFTLLMSVRE